MQLNAILCVWNEEDIIESTIRHAFAQGCADVYLIDNGSSDKTVSRAVAAGAKLVMSFQTDVFDEVKKVFYLNATVEHLNKQADVDSMWWLYLDADEFPDIDGPKNLLEYLRALPPEIRAVHGYLHDHIPTHPPYHVRGFHPADTMPVSRKTKSSKIPLLRYDRGKPHIHSRGGAHSFDVEGDTIPILKDTLTIHHFPLRDPHYTKKRLELLLRKNADGTSRIDWIDRLAQRRSKKERSGYHDRYRNLLPTYEHARHGAFKETLSYDFAHLRRWYDVRIPKSSPHISREENHIANGLYFFFLGNYNIALLRFNEAFMQCDGQPVAIWLYIKIIECMLRTNESISTDMVTSLLRSNDPEVLDYVKKSVLPLMDGVD